MSLIIRRATADDVPHLAELARAHAATVTTDYVRSHPVYAASEGTRLVGFYALEEEEGEAWVLRHLWVAPEWAGRGRGRWMFTDAVRRVRRGQGRTLHLVPEPGAERFFLRMGLVPAGGFLVLDAQRWEEPLPDSVSDAGSAE